MARKKYRPLFSPKKNPLRWVEIASCVSVFFGLFLIAAVCYFEFFAAETQKPEALLSEMPISGSEPDFIGPPSPLTDPSLLPPLPPLSDAAEPDAAKATADEDADEYRASIESGDTAGAILQEWLDANEINSLVEACRNVYPMTRLRVGQPYSIIRENNEFARFEYEIDNEQRLIVSREKGLFKAVKEAIEYEIRLVKVEGSIESSLFEAMDATGESPTLALRLADIFAWEINFIRDLQPGDGFRVLVEKRYRDGELKGYGAITAAEFVNRSSKFEAYRFEDSFGNYSYFNAGGDSLRRAFLKAPLSFSRISSRFNMKRKHPIFASVRPHPAVDYAAPSGTPVKAIGSGVVSFKGWGNGAGNYISLVHANGYESMYLHLSGFAKTLKKGGRVRQGEIIGYVGSTGYSTGPHLDFRMKKNGNFLNPEKILSPRDDSVPKNKLESFKAERDSSRQFLEGFKALAEYGREKEKSQ